MFAKNTLASAVAAAIGVSAVGVAQADTVFFPYAALSPTVTTIVSVINTSRNMWQADGQTPVTDQRGNLHYRFYYKSVADGERLLDPCVEYNEPLPSSWNDIQTIDLGGVFGADTAGVLFDDPSVNNQWQQSGRDYAFGRNVQPARGYLTVDNSDSDNGNLTMSGEAFVFEFGSGAVWGYQAYESDTYPGGTTVPFDINNPADFRHVASKSPSNIAVMPFTEVTTAFFVTPIAWNQHPDLINNYRARVDIRTTTRGDMYDRDENLVSGTIPADVVCVGRVNVADMLSDGTRARLVNGGWGRVYNYPVAQVGSDWVPSLFNRANFDAGVSSGLRPLGVSVNDPAFSAVDHDGAVVIKLEYNLGGTFNGEAVGGVYNNAIMFQPDPVNAARLP